MKEIALNPQDFTKSFESNLSDYVRNRIITYNFKYYETSNEESDECTLRIVKTLLEGKTIQSGEHRISQWENGWVENLNNLQNDSNLVSIIPKYFSKFNILRWHQKFIKPVSENFELNMLRIILDWLIDKYMRDAENIYEFGCGTGHHLINVRTVNPKCNLFGLDWVESSQRIIETFAKQTDDTKLFAHKFDYFNPDNNFVLEDNAVIYTVASLEQIGKKYDKFVDYLFLNNPRLCIHIEPIEELLDQNNLLDYLSIEYFKKRNYLSGFLNYLYKLQAEGRAEILTAQRTYIGSLFIEGYSVVVWHPIS